jgi:pimeloyl-ACP methyl ester carboxylesterase
MVKCWLTSLSVLLVQEAVRGILDTPTLWLFSGQDEFVPSGVDKQALRSMYDKLLLHAASRCMIVEGAPHSLTGFEDQAVGHMIDFIQRI